MCTFLVQMSLSKYTTIHCAEELQAGDHISWSMEQLSGMLSHHAIVVAHRHGNQFKVIHVVNNADSADLSSCSASSLPVPGFAKVCEQVIDLSQHMGNGTLCRYDYEPGSCKEPAEVIQNARSKLGQFSYDLLNNNCEHFARWCKTGNDLSIQASIAKGVLKLGYFCASKLAEKTLGIN